MTPEEITYIRRRDHYMKFQSKPSDSSAILVVLVICLVGYCLKDSVLANRLFGKSYQTI